MDFIGKLLVSAGRDRRIFFVRVRDFVVLGYRELDDEITCVEWVECAEGSKAS